MTGLSWFGVDTTLRLPPSDTSHVQPDPNRFTPASLICAFSWSTSPKAERIADSSAPDGSPPPLGFMISQKSVWFAWPPPLLRTAARLSSGIASRLEIASSTGRSAHSVPSSALFRLSTYAWWCLPWWMRIVSASIVGSSASYSYGSGGRSWGIASPSGRRRAEDMLRDRGARLQPRGDPAARAEAGAVRARRHLARDDRGALQALRGLRRETERDPRQARRRRPHDREPGLLRDPRPEGRAHVRDRRDQEPRGLLRAPRRRRRRPRRALRRPRQARLRLHLRLARRPQGDGHGRPRLGLDGVRLGRGPALQLHRRHAEHVPGVERDAARGARRLRARLLHGLRQRPRRVHRRVPRQPGLRGRQRLGSEVRRPRALTARADGTVSTTSAHAGIPSCGGVRGDRRRRLPPRLVPVGVLARARVEGG